MKFLIAAALLGCALAVQKVPLKKVQSIREKLTETGEIEQFLIWKNRQAVFDQFAAAGSSLPLKDYSDITYVAQVSIGTPAQTFTVIPDTGSSDLWLPDYTCAHKCGFMCIGLFGLCNAQRCDACACHKNSLKESAVSFAAAGGPCAGKHFFQSKQSTSYKKNGRHFSIQYGTGSCSGFLGSDDVQYGGINIKQQTFGQATSLAQFFTGQPFDGILGMGYPQLASSGATPVFNTMIEQKAVSKPIFGVYMSENAGELTLGDYDSTKFTGDINYVSVTRPGYWQYKLNGMTVNGKSVSNGGSAISDTGTSLLAGPSSVVSAVANELKGKFDRSQGLYEVDCSIQDAIVLSIAGKQYNIQPVDYILKLQSKCYLGFQPLPFGTAIDYILGDVFHRAVYHIYDFGNNRVGFATSKH